MRKTGYNVNTMQEIMFRGGGGNSPSQPGGGIGTIYQDYDTADYAADTSIPEANYRIDFTHLIGTTAYLWTVIKTEDNRAILPVDWWQGENELQLWFIDDAKSIRVIISP